MLPSPESRPIFVVWGMYKYIYIYIYTYIFTHIHIYIYIFINLHLPRLHPWGGDTRIPTKSHQPNILSAWSNMTETRIPTKIVYFCCSDKQAFFNLCSLLHTEKPRVGAQILALGIREKLPSLVSPFPSTAPVPRIIAVQILPGFFGLEPFMLEIYLDNPQQTQPCL